MNGFEYDFARSRMDSLLAEAEQHRLVSTARRERREAKAAARAARPSGPFRKVFVLAGAALHNVAS